MEAPAQRSRYDTAPNILGKEQNLKPNSRPWSADFNDNGETALLISDYSSLDYKWHLLSKTNNLTEGVRT